MSQIRPYCVNAETMNVTDKTIFVFFMVYLHLI